MIKFPAYDKLDTNPKALLKKYELTLAEYEIICKNPPPESIWCKPEDRFGNDDERYVTINLYRMAITYTLK